jgi:(1->4)-alpha-D-glucan 1-alpha-D-glucosylmutase
MLPVRDSPVEHPGVAVEALAHQTPEQQRRIPASTYRLQFHAGFTFVDAAALVPYLAALGISDCYCSSYLQAVPGSMHGYDVADPTSLNPEIGTEEDYRRFVDTLSAHGMSHLLDVVPNHMGIARSRNRWWQDVLENGPSSRYAKIFDIDWQPLKPELAHKVLLPILGDQYGTVLERGDIQVFHEDGSFCLRYFETTLPLSPRSYVAILRHRVDELTRELGEEHPDLVELLSIITSLERLPPRYEQDPERLAERHREKQVAKRRLSELMQRSDAVRAFVHENVRLFNGQRGVPGSFDLLDRLLGDQAYRLAHWRVASEEINYRRFFDINELAAVRMEDPDVFNEAHHLVFQLLRERAITGLRIDHVDGLYDPGDYLRRLQARARELGLGTSDRPLYIVVEKILGPDEPLPDGWPMDGTTGYEFANAVNGLFVHQAHARAFDEIYGRFTTERTPFADIAYRKKKLIMQVSMAGEINVLAHRLNLFSERNRHYRDFTLNSLVHAIREIIACFPVYRTYISPGPEPPSGRDEYYILRAVEEAKRRNPATAGHVFDFIRDLLLKRADYIPESERDEYLRFVTRFQQTTSPVTAKGIEDTAFYCYNRLVSLNEVGGEPARFGLSPDELHRWLADRRREWPSALSTTSTHDTKRSEDVRARISVLSEIPGAWRLALGRWARWNRRHHTTVSEQHAPDRNEEYLLYQTLLGAWPLEMLDGAADETFVTRICEYMTKALREAKRHSSWTNPNRAWEEAARHFVRQVLNPTRSGRFLDDLRPLAVRVAQSGMWNSLAQTLIKITAPGVPDFYQGTEIWDFSLVDPDNRRPVDYGRRQSLLDRIHGLLDAIESGQQRSGQALDELVRSRADGRIKMYVTSVALRARRNDPDLYLRGDYVALPVTGTRAAHVFAFGRALGGRALVTIVPRLTATLLPDPAAAPIGRELWADTTVYLPRWLDRPAWRAHLTGDSLVASGGAVRVGEALERFPVALLTAGRQHS